MASMIESDEIAFSIMIMMVWVLAIVSVDFSIEPDEPANHRHYYYRSRVSCGRADVVCDHRRSKNRRFHLIAHINGLLTVLIARSILKPLRRFSADVPERESFIVGVIRSVLDDRFPLKVD